MYDDEIIDRAAQDQEDVESMIEAWIDRQIFAEIKKADMEQPQATDFTRIVRPSTDVFSVKLDHVLQVRLDSRWVTVGHHSALNAALQAELAISQAMIEYRTKRNAWERQESCS